VTLGYPLPMPARKVAPPPLEIHPLTPDRFADLEALFGPRGASSGCWCMYWRLRRAEYRAGKGDGNHAAFQRYVDGHVPGLLAYRGASPVGWVAVEPRVAYPRLDTIPALASVDARPVWSIPCFFVARAARHQGVTRALISAAVEHARAGGAQLVEAYPSDVDDHRQDASIFLGVASTFRKLGFEVAAKREPRRVILRLDLARSGGPARAIRKPARPARVRAASRSRPRTRRQRASASRRDR